MDKSVCWKNGIIFFVASVIRRLRISCTGSDLHGRAQIYSNYHENGGFWLKLYIIMSWQSKNFDYDKPCKACYGTLPGP